VSRVTKALLLGPGGDLGETAALRCLRPGLPGANARPRRPFGESLRREEGRRNGRIDVDHGEGGARLQHGVQRRLPVSPSAVSHRSRDSDHRGVHQTRNDGRKRALPAGEHEVDLWSVSLQPPESGEKPVKPGDPDVVGPNDPEAQFAQNSLGLFGEGHVARSGGDDRDDPVAIPGTERASESNKTVVGEESQPRRPAGGRAPSAERSNLRGGRPRDEGSEPPVRECFDDRNQVLYGLSLPQNYLGHPDAMPPLAVEPGEVPDA
jgi:hypothetical protein